MNSPLTAHQCENELVGAGPVDGDRESCRRHAITVCAHCGNYLCGRCADSCYECGFNFCMGTDCLEDHAKDLGHQVDLPPRITVASAGMRAEIPLLPEKRGVASVRGVQ
jgi:hypothetical protein